jgi:hypothetical protein
VRFEGANGGEESRGAVGGIRKAKRVISINGFWVRVFLSKYFFCEYEYRLLLPIVTSSFRRVHQLDIHKRNRITLAPSETARTRRKTHA